MYGKYTFSEDLERAVIRRKRAIEMMEETGETDEVKKLITRLCYCPCQSPEKRYECVKLSQKEGNFKFFIKIAEFLADNFTYRVLPLGDEEHHVDEYHGNRAYDFNIILSLARFYQKHETLFEGHMDIIRKIRTPIYFHHYRYKWWENLKQLWLSMTKE